MSRLGRVTLLGLGLLGSLMGRAQVLARPGWAGSGVAPEAWWLRAVFYRIDPARFQDSDGDGQGDIQGIIERLDYIQSLGVDALVLDGQLSADQLSDLVREASRHHLRLVTTLRPLSPLASRDSMIEATRASLRAGAAGVWVPRPSAETMDAPDYSVLLAALPGLLQSFPGERVLLTDPAPTMPSTPGSSMRSSRHSIDPGTFGAARGGVLVATTTLLATGKASDVHESLAVANGSPGAGMNPLLVLSTSPAADANQALASAAMLLGGRGAVMLNFGQELGLNTFPRHVEPVSAPVMQWTPSNRTQASIQRSDSAAASVPSAEFGSYHPYVRAPREFTPPPSASGRVTSDPNLPGAPPDPDSLPGFTSGPISALPADSSRLNVVAEDRDPSSLLNAYRQLIALHHGNATLRNGALQIVGDDSGRALVWLRRAPAGSRTVADVLAAVNFSDQSVVLSLNRELESLGVRPGPVRALFASPAGELTGATTEHLNLPPHAVLLGELPSTRTASPRRFRTASRPGVRR